MVTAAQEPKQVQPPTGVVGRGRTMQLAGIGLVLVLGAVFVFVNRAEISHAIDAARRANPLFLVLAGLLSAGLILNQAALYQAAYHALGLHVPFRAMLRLAAAAHFLNLVATSGGMAGLAVFLQDAARRGQPRGQVTAAYVLCGLLGHLAFTLALVVALMAVWVERRLTTAEVVASAVFAVYTLAYSVIIIAGARSRTALRALYALPRQVVHRLRRLLGQPGAERAANHQAADDLYAAIGVLIHQPRSVLRPAFHALLVELLGVATLWMALLSFGRHPSISLPLIGYAISVLFEIVWVLPAGIGAVEVSLSAVLVSFDVPVSVAAVTVLTYRLCAVWLPFAIGAWAAQSLAWTPVQGTDAAGRWPGLGGRWRRRAVAAAVAGLGLLNVALVLVKHPPLRVPLVHSLIPHAAVAGSRYVLLASGLALLASVGGLLHGKRQAWRIATAAAVAAAVMHPLKRTDVLGTSASALTLLLLLTTARRFPARSDPVRARQGVYWLLAGGLGVLIYGFAGLYLLDAEFHRPVDLREALENALRLLFILPATTIEPVTRHGSWFIDSARVLALVVLGVAVWHLLHPVILRATAATAVRQRVRALLESYATTSLAYFYLLDDKSYFFADDGRAVIGYKVVGNVAVALGEPIGAPEACSAVARAFAEFCDLNGWAYCFYQVVEAGAAELQGLGLRVLKIGEEAIVPVQEFVLTGRAVKGIRHAVNRLEREGYRVEHMPQPIDDATMAELAAVSDAWLAHGGHRERTFTLGAFSPDYLRATDVFVVRAPDGRIDAFANVIPSFRAPNGNVDLMRRRPDAPNGVIEYLFVHLIAIVQARGLAGMTLGLAPLAGIAGTDLKARALRLLYERGERAFRFRGLRAFKDKWQPRWEPRYLVYRSDLQLPQLALAITRAGERSPSGLPAWGPLSRLRRRPHRAATA